MEGLNKQEIDYRINNGLINNENIKNSRNIKTIILSNLINLFNLIHIILFILVLTTGEIANATFMFAICFNIIISIYQEIKAKRIIDNLKITTTEQIKVIRNNELITIKPEEILLDDLLYLKQGDSLVVDAKIIKSDNLEVDESIITGESDAIIKKENDELISGSIIISGSGYAKVTSINRDTFANKLIKEASKTKDDSSYLMHQINNILKIVTILIIPIGVLLFITQFYHSGQTYSASVLSSVAGIIGMIPDGLVLLTSISLTVGVIKMASKKVIIQKLSGIELLACVDTLCLDKTGTITSGSMSVIDLIKIDNRTNIENILKGMAQIDGNATDKAIYEKYGNDSTLNLVSKIPFSSARKYALSVFTEGIYAIGALEYITNKEIAEYECLNEYLNAGYRILTIVDCHSKFDKNENRVLAFVILKDNIRDNAKETLEYFAKQEVDVKIISGDNPITVSNLLKQIEIPDYDKYIDGNKLPEDYNKLKELVDNYKIFGRVTPYQKQLIVKALREKHTVGYIGDGVNDILALKEADCGIALASGISAARSVSEVVLTDSDFSVLTGIVNEGRRVVNNIERVASMYLIKTVYSFLISILCIILSHEYPFFPIQLSLISGICVGLPSFFLAIEPNYNKVTKGFLVKVFRNALPSALCVFLNVTFLIIISELFKIDFDTFRFTIVALTGFISLRLLYNVSKPLSLLRKVLVILCISIFYLLLIIFRKILLIKVINIWSIVFLIILITSSIYIIDFFEELYDKIVLILKNKRSRVVYEK